MRQARLPVSGTRAAGAVAARRGDVVAPGDMLALQGRAGNAAVSSALGHTADARPARTGTPVQRAGAEEQGTASANPSRGAQARGTVSAGGRTGGETLALGSELANPAATATIGADFIDPSVSTTDSYNVGVAGPAATALVAGAALPGNVRDGIAARQGLKQAPQGSGQRHAFKRDRRAADADGAQNAGTVLSGMANAAGGAMNLAGQAPATYNAVLSGGGGVGLPVAALQTGRYIRKAVKARKRVKELEALMLRQDQQPAVALRAAKEEVEARLASVHALDKAFEAAHAEYKARVEDQSRPADERLYPDTTIDLLGDLVLTYEDLEKQLQEAVSAHTAAVQEAAQRELVQEAIKNALNEVAAAVARSESDGDEQITLRQIQQYATRKNSRGVNKKMVTALSGALGVSAGVATLISTIAIAAGATAGAAILVTTPVGWGLAAAAATVALSLASYKAWQTIAKRWEQTATEAPEDSTFRHLGKTLAFWRRTGRSERTQYATALYRFAQSTDPVQGELARDTVGTLGLDWDRIGGDEASAIKLIAAKLAS
ncbi:hypothetical protein [Streptomyces sp. NBC_01012]|uniref:hypothetical protein n=1 Tax=Streptomyces sp. NBC_01012 TaxID=2903717 RepID=UPI00386AC8AE|nr:hypothetical protein OG623_11495 [Streptomyces sp. NBC_01012]